MLGNARSAGICGLCPSKAAARLGKGERALGHQPFANPREGLDLTRESGHLGCGRAPWLRRSAPRQGTGSGAAGGRRRRRCAQRDIDGGAGKGGVRALAFSNTPVTLLDVKPAGGRSWPDGAGPAAAGSSSPRGRRLAEAHQQRRLPCGGMPGPDWQPGHRFKRSAAPRPAGGLPWPICVSVPAPHRFQRGNLFGGDRRRTAWICAAAAGPARKLLLRPATGWGPVDRWPRARRVCGS